MDRSLLPIENRFGIIAWGIEHAREAISIQLAHRQHRHNITEMKEITMEVRVILLTILKICNSSAKQILDVCKTA